MKRSMVAVLPLLLLLISPGLLADPPVSGSNDQEADLGYPDIFHLKQWTKADGGNDHYYGILTYELTHEEAATAAGIYSEPGSPGYLATITSFEENQFIFDEVIGVLNQKSIIDQYWLGGTYADETWSWMSGEAFIFEHWAPYEPNNLGVETVIAMWGPRNYADLRRPGRWNNSLPNDSINQFVFCWSIIEWGDFDTTTVAPDPDTLINLFQWTEAEGGNDHWYGILSLEMYWTDAALLATTLGQDGMNGYLATILSAEENQFILENLIDGQAQPSILDAYWLGGSDAGGLWGWETGEEFGYTNWAFGEPNNEGIETVVCLWGGDSWKYNRQPGSWNNSLPDPTINPLAKWWAIVEWGTPDLDPYVPDTLKNLTQWKKSDGGNDHWYAVLPQDVYANELAGVAEQYVLGGMAGYLTTVTSLAENNFVFDNVIKMANQSNYNDRYWLGGTYINGELSWNTGEPFIFEFWAAYQPTNQYGYSALAMFGPNNWWESERPSMWSTAARSASINYSHHWYALIEWGEYDTTTVLPQPDSIMNLVQWPVAEGGNDHYYAVMTTTEYWFQANARARTLEHEGMMGYLTTITTEEENYFILDNVLAGTNQTNIMDAFWMGGYEVDQIWQWITGEPFDYTNWAYGEPNNIGIEKVNMMWGPNSWKSNRQPGSWNNSLEDYSVNPLARWWSIIEWGEPDQSSSIVFDDHPNNYDLEQNYPNPFNPTTIVAFSIPTAQAVKLEIFNIRGQLVTTLADQFYEAGHHQIEWDSRDHIGDPVASGVYLYRVKTGDFTKTKKMVLVR